MSCQMHCNRLRLALGAALVAFVLSTPALGAFYNPHFDPEFDGLVTFQIGDACLLNAPGTYQSTGACTLDLISADVFSTADPGTHFTSGFQGNVGLSVVIAGNELVEISTDPPLSCGELCSGALVFFTGFCDGDCVPPSAELTGDTFQGVLMDGYTLVRVSGPGTAPEPDTLALLVGGVAAAWLVRRRKAQSRTDGNA